MLFRDVIDLVSVTTTTNDMGDIIDVETKRQVFADKKSVRQNEFYQAAATGLKPELMFVIRTVEYKQERKLEFNLKTYSIIRTYEKENEFTELVCSGIVNGVT